MVSLQPNYVSTLPGKTKNNIKNSRQFTAVRSFELIIPDFCRMSFNVRFFPYLLENFSSSLLVENVLHSHRFESIIYPQTQCD